VTWGHAVERGTLRFFKAPLNAAIQGFRISVLGTGSAS